MLLEIFNHLRRKEIVRYDFDAAIVVQNVQLRPKLLAYKNFHAASFLVTILSMMPYDTAASGRMM